jgi:hypothetical protein
MWRARFGRGLGPVVRQTTEKKKSEYVMRCKKKAVFCVTPIKGRSPMSILAKPL